MDAFDAVRRVARWLDTRAGTTPAGLSWPSVGIADGTAGDGTLAWGPAGVVLFLLRAYETLGDEAYLAAATAGARTLLASPPAPAGLYRGAAGRAYVLAEAHRVTGDEAYRETAAHLAARLRPERDIVGLYDGAAGTGLALLHLAVALDDPALEERALDVAARIAGLAVEAGPGHHWPVPGRRRELPNFSRGTAGVAFFLAAAARVSGDEAFAGAAVGGGRYLAALARTDFGGCEVPVVSDAPDVWPNWCNGTAGTGRLWAALATLTGDARWDACLAGAASAVAGRFRPDGTAPELGNEVSLCCGSAGMLDFLLDAHVATGDAGYADGAARAARHLELFAVDSGGTRCWVQGRRSRTGWLEGAAGVGYALLRWGAFQRGLPLPAALPDSPVAPFVSRSVCA
jgi:lantibiotic modifying enzyme